MDKIDTLKQNEILLRNQNYVNVATRPNTRKAYQADIRHFISSGGLLPATPEHIIQYLEANARNLNPRTLVRRVIAIKQWHVYQNYVDPTIHPVVSKTLKGIQNTLGKPKIKARIITIAEIQQMVEYLNAQKTLIALRDKSILLIGFFGAFRRSELVGINREDIRELSEGIEILIPRSKTDPTGEGQICAVPYGMEPLCPVTAILDWYKASNIKSGKVFRRISKADNLLVHSIAPNHINVILKKLAMKIGLTDYNAISSHSLRRSFATIASQQGATFKSIMQQGRWRNERTVLEYIEAGKAFEDNAAHVILETSIKTPNIE